MARLFEGTPVWLDNHKEDRPFWGSNSKKARAIHTFGSPSNKCPPHLKNKIRKSEAEPLQVRLQSVSTASKAVILLLQPPGTIWFMLLMQLLLLLLLAVTCCSRSRRWNANHICPNLHGLCCLSGYQNGAPFSSKVAKTRGARIGVWTVGEGHRHRTGIFLVCVLPFLECPVQLGLKAN